MAEWSFCRAMVSKLSFFTSFGSISSVCRHWTLVILLASLLNVADKSAPLAVSAESSLHIYHLEDAARSHSTTSDNPINIAPLTNYTQMKHPLVSIPLPGMPHLKNYAVILSVVSPDDSTSAKFVMDVTNPEETSKPSFGEALLYGFFGVTITNLCALTGLICIPIQRSKYYNLMLTFMMALAVGALGSTAIIVLIPEAMRMVDMPAEFGGQGRSYLIKMGAILAGVLFFYALEYLLFILPRMLKWNTSSTNVNLEEAGGDFHGHSHTIPVTVEVSADEDSLDISSKESDDVIVLKKKRHCGFHFSRKQFASIAPVAWMILLGDGFHNMMDGLTIGAGFSQSPIVGVTLSLSILFEELPHELGDFAILISSGFSVKAALCANFLSACSAYIGLGIGLAIGEVPSGAFYVFAVTAGFFLYISLSDMLPELRRSINEAEIKNENSFKIFCLHILGFTIGFLCVLGVTISSDYINF